MLQLVYFANKAKLNNWERSHAHTHTVLTPETNSHDSYVKTCSSGDFNALASFEELHALKQVRKMSSLLQTFWRTSLRSQVKWKNEANLSSQKVTFSRFINLQGCHGWNRNTKKKMQIFQGCQLGHLVHVHSTITEVKSSDTGRCYLTRALLSSSQHIL